MDTDDIDAHVAKLENIGATLSEDYRVAAGTVSANLGAIGKGELLSQTFRSTFDSPAHTARLGADKLIGSYALLAAAGRDSVAGYVAADAAGERSMPRPI